jgi:hypothetical protein
MEYVYELRRGDEIVATGRLSIGRELALDDVVPFGIDEAVVRELRPSAEGMTFVVLEIRGARGD